MADAILHIKDSYYFEVPKFLVRSNYPDKFFPNFWVRLDDEFQEWEADRLYEKLQSLADKDEGFGALPAKEKLIADWKHWQHHDHANHGKPFDVYLEEHAALLNAEFKSWRASSLSHKNEDLDTFLSQANPKHESFGWFATRLAKKEWAARWTEAKEQAGGDAAVEAYKVDPNIKKWDAKKVEGYNNALHGKILIPQPFGVQKNLYEMESGLGISKFMIIEIVMVLGIAAVFIWLASRVRSSDRPKGKIWNLLEAVLLFIRDQIARPAIDSHDHAEGHGDHGHSDHGHGEHGHDTHGHGEKALAHHKAKVEHEGDKYVPYLWTVFLFVLAGNLMGMLPWVGSPTASFSVTLALAGATFLMGLISGSKKFGIIGYWKNLVPSMGLPICIAVLLVPMLFAIEVLGLFIKHGVLGIRLLANMVAGHLVLLAVMNMAFSLEGATSSAWPITAVIAVLGSTAFSCLELFVAFLQAYVFTFLSALFIGAAVHKH